MFTDELRRNVWQQIRQRDLRQFERFLPPALIKQAAVQAGARMGRGALNLATLTWLGLASAFHSTQNFASVLSLTIRLLQDNGQWLGKDSAPSTGQAKGLRGKSKPQRSKRSKHDPHGTDPNHLSEEAFVQARHHMPLGYWIKLILILGEQFQKEHGPLLHWKSYRLLALDGSCIQLPGHAALAEHFGRASNGHGSRTVQARMVMLQFPLVRLPWLYELSGIQEGERTVAQRLLNHLRPQDLVLMDRGFWSYGLFWQIAGRQSFFAVRLMKGVKFKTVKHLGCKDRLVSWTPSERKWRGAGLPASIQLRVIDYQIKGFRPSAIVTNVLSARSISREEWVRLTTQSDPGRRLDPGLYHRRWEIETTFLELKVVQGMEGSLRSRTPQGIAYEVRGHVVLYLLVRWLMVEAALEHGQDPLHLSFTNALREVRQMSQTLLLASLARVTEVLLPLLSERIASHPVPWRPGRHDPRPGDTRVRNVGKGKYRLPNKLVA